MSSSAQRRVTQRAPQSCVYCSRRKLRCSKTIPCTNCVERGIQVRCHREAVILSNQSLRLRARSTASPANHVQTPTSPDTTVEGALKSVTTAESMPRALNKPRLTQTQGSPEDKSPTNLSDTSNAPVINPMAKGVTLASMEPNDGDLATEAAMSLESLAWGTTHLEHSKVLPSASVLTLLGELQSIIDAQAAREIVYFHKRHVAWMHNVVYMPFFVRECEAYLTGRLQRDAAWLSLYCAVLCTGVYYMNEQQHRNLGLVDGYMISRKLYQITIESIMRSDFMVVQSLQSIQAISVILMCAHAYGDSRRMKMLLACANTIAQNIGHRLHLQSSTASRALPFGELVDREVRRRIWYFLCTQDWYLIASKKSYSITPNHGTTVVPSNCIEDLEDVTENEVFRDMPLSIQTQSTYMIFLFKLTSLYRALFDRLSVIHSEEGSVGDCFDAVLSADSELETIMGDIEHCHAGARSDRARYLPKQWRALIIASWHKRVMIHRSFFCRSFQDRRYHYSRFVSLAAARNIIRAYLEASHSQDTAEIWSVPSHAISACIIITLNSLFSAEKHTLEESDVELMHRCLALLRESPRPNSIVDRGVQIIQYLLNQGPQNRFKTLDPQEISQLARDIDSTASISHQDGSLDAEHQFPEAMASQLDILESVSHHFGDDELFMPYWYDPTMQGYSL